MAFFIYLDCVAIAPSMEVYCAADFCGSGPIAELCSGLVTPADALGIFKAYLGYPDPCAKSVGAAKLRGAAGDPEVKLIEMAAGASGDVLIAVEAASGSEPLDAWGVTVRFDATALEFTSCRAGGLDPGWQLFGCRESAPGEVTIGAMSFEALPPGSHGTLAFLRFAALSPLRAAAQTPRIWLADAVDGLDGAMNQ